MGFKASEVYETLDYDFRPYASIVGTSPEPSSEQVRKFQEKFKAIRNRMRGEQESDSESEEEDRKLVEFMASLTSDEIRSIEQEINEIFSELLSGKPSVEELNELASKSYRHHQAYIGSVIGDIFDPEASDAVLSRSREAKNGVVRITTSKRN